MMELNTIIEEFDHVTKKQKLSASKSQEIIDQLSIEIEKVLSKIQSSDDPSSKYKPIISELKTKLNEIAPLSQLEEAQKELNIALSKHQKLLENSFNTDISKAYRNVEFDIHTLNHIITNHFYRQGQFEIGDCFLNEANEDIPEPTRAEFKEMYRILKDMWVHNLDSALIWAGNNREKINQNGSDLELKLHRMQFIEIVKQKNEEKRALNYLREFISPFDSRYMRELSVLSTCLLWTGDLENSPYSEILDPTHLMNLQQEFIRQYCNILGKPYESPLSVTIAAGFQGLPTLIKLKNAMVGKENEWETMKQLPVPMDLDNEFQFYSVFICPVSRERACEENPPMSLPCGHIFCKQTIINLLNSDNEKAFKCPYCPAEIKVGNCLQLYL